VVLRALDMGLAESSENIIRKLRICGMGSVLAYIIAESKHLNLKVAHLYM
jgi:hypothetical protein